MKRHSTLLPGQSAPELTVDLVGGGQWKLSEVEADNFVLIDFYRGFHCPRCKLHIIDLNNKIARFADRGVSCVAISMNEREKAEGAVQDWGLGNIPVGYGLTEAQAREWGLYLTDSINVREPGRFSEPATLLVRPGGGELHSAVYGTNPFNRIHAADILEGLDAVLARDYPARGDVE